MSAKKKRSPGRPPGAIYPKTVNVRMTEAEYATLKRLAAEDRRSLSATLVVRALGGRS